MFQFASSTRTTKWLVHIDNVCQTRKLWDAWNDAVIILSSFILIRPPHHSLWKEKTVSVSASASFLYCKIVCTRVYKIKTNIPSKIVGCPLYSAQLLALMLYLWILIYFITFSNWKEKWAVLIVVCSDGFMGICQIAKMSRKLISFIIEFLIEFVF